MGGVLNVDLTELRASASFARTIADELDGPISAAIRGSSSAAVQLAGWSIAPALEQISSDWGPVLAAVRARMTDTAANLEATAQGHEWQDHSVAELMKGLGAR